MDGKYLLIPKLTEENTALKHLIEQQAIRIAEPEHRFNWRKI